jgi:hypothetical protein
MGDYWMPSFVEPTWSTVLLIAKKSAAALAVAYLICLQQAQAQVPQAEIHNKALKVTIDLPDAQNGFYKGVRFEGGGSAIADLEFAGHHLYRPWFSSTDASVPDFTYKDGEIVAGTNSAMSGPAEEFQAGIGYADAAIGGTFLKVGVGILRKADNNPYRFATHFDVVDGGKWTVSKTSTSVTFTQVLGGADSDYGYVYTKTIRLVGNTSQLVIEHHLKNTGKLPIATPLYDHNFLTIDGLSVGKSYTVAAPYDLKPTRPADSKFVNIDGKTATYIADLQGQDRVSFGLQGYSGDVKDYDFTITNKAAGVEVRIQGDHPVTNATVWSIRSILAVEPFIQVQADPGKEFDWSYTYTYSSVSKLP